MPANHTGFARVARAWQTLARSLPLVALACTAGAAGPVASNRPSATLVVAIAPGVAMDFIRVPAGMFLMGSEPYFAEGDEIPRHQVTITHSFYLGKYEVTQRQWSGVMGSNPSVHRGDNLPVENVSWTDCQAFLAKLSAATGRRFALPTEAQWEYACRAGTTTRWYFGEDEAATTAHAWIGANSGGRPHVVGGKPPNPWGFHDMYGNVWEWCSDWYANPYPNGDAVDPTGPAAGAARVTRGGAWGDDPGTTRSAYRNSMGPNRRNDGTGLRIVLVDDGAVSPASPTHGSTNAMQNGVHPHG
ncbi:MAG TPA: formylglycine-generating enzyme family protein [Opitutaceae bacterium]|nr:formylglycine-generating enzyme family protein [Opitutaceae bacterium]